MLFPARGMPRRIPPRRPVVLHPGDGVGFGGALPKQLTLVHALAKMHIYRVTEIPERPDEDDAGEQSIIETLACVVCQETMLAPRVLCCGHMFCDDCISRWFRDKARTFPIVSLKLTPRDRTPARRAESPAPPTPSPRAARAMPLCERPSTRRWPNKRLPVFL
jgi:hypothetical protein